MPNKTTKTSKKLTGKRAAIKAILCKGAAHSVQYYVNKVAAYTGRVYTPYEIVSALRNMFREGQLVWSTTNRGAVYGELV